MKFKTKPDKLRLASRITWIVGFLLTFQYIVSGLPFIWYYILAAFIGSAIIQFILSLSESAIFEANVSHPFKREMWTTPSAEPWVWIFAVVCLIVDVMLNLGGISVILKYFNETVEGNWTWVGDIATLVFSVFTALGSDILKKQADLIEGLDNKPKSVIMPASVKEQNKLAARLEQRKDKSNGEA